MELRIKTYDEVSSERVTIEVSPGQKVEIQMSDSSPSADDHAPDGPWDRLQKRAEEVDRLKRELAEVMSQRLYTEDDVIAAQASEGELISKALQADIDQQKAEITSLKRELTEVMSQRNQYQRERNDLTTEVRRLEARIQGLGVRHQLALADLRVEKAEQTQKAEAFKAQAYGENDKAAALRTQLAESRKLVADLTIRNQQALRVLSTEQVEKDLDEVVTKIGVRLTEAIKAARIELRGTSQA